MFGNKVPVQTPSLANQAAQAAEQAIQATQRASNHALDGLSGSVQDLRQQAEPMLQRVSDQASMLAQRGVDSLRDTTQQLRDRATEATDNTANYIKDEPFKSILIAAATGAALMGLLTLLSRSRRP
jgi:ElaB/YqjD/DUF883 family membrane-anchored ribosome-binding protein